MSNEQTKLEDEIQQLIGRLEHLSVEQRVVAKKLQELKGKLNQERRRSQGKRRRASGVRKTDDQDLFMYDFGGYRFRDISGTTYRNADTPNVGDIVRIVNPDKYQVQVGRIVGCFKDKKVKIDTYQETPVIRAVKNIRFIDVED